MYVDSSDDTDKPDSMQPAAKTLRDSLEDMLKVRIFINITIPKRL